MICPPVRPATTSLNNTMLILPQADLTKIGAQASKPIAQHGRRTYERSSATSSNRIQETTNLPREGLRDTVRHFQTFATHHSTAVSAPPGRPNPDPLLRGMPFRLAPGSQ